MEIFKKSFNEAFLNYQIDYLIIPKEPFHTVINVIQRMMNYSGRISCLSWVTIHYQKAEFMWSKSNIEET